MRRKTSWELVTCARRGHVLVGIDAETLLPEHAVFARELDGLRWHRCLRCDTWRPLAPPDSPARKHPPGRDEIEIPERGKALRDKIVLRVIAADRVLHFVVLSLLGIAVLFVARHETALRGDFYRVVADLQRGVAGGPVESTPQHGVLHELAKLFAVRAGTLTRAGVVILGYGILEGIEAVGLWMGKRWAEYLTFVATTLLIPYEIYELTLRVSAFKLVALAINLAVALYLLLAKRLFGLRGGHRADMARRGALGGWEAIEKATPQHVGSSGQVEPEPASL
jgi:uncharacterized membrane protein (DUF2068 family)